HEREGWIDMTLQSEFRAARHKSVPLIGIETSDPAVTRDRLAPVIGDAPLILWDAVRGFRGGNDEGMSAIGAHVPSPHITPNIIEALIAAERLPALSVVLMSNAHRFYGEAPVMQAIWNLRDQYKDNGRTLVLLGPVLRLPAELEGDVVVYQ